MKISHLTCFLLILMTAAVTVTIVLQRAQLSKDDSKQLFESLNDNYPPYVVNENEIDRRKDVIGAISNPIIKERDVYLHYMWEQYKNSSTSERPTLLKKIRDELTKIAYLDSRIDLIGWILFGPKAGQSFLHSIRDIKHPIVDDLTCLRSTLRLFEKHCGVVTEQSITQSLANLCNYVVEKEAIREAIILACGRQNTESYVLDVENPKIDVFLAPIHGTFQYCGRVSVNRISRTKLQSNAKTYQITVDASNSMYDDLYKMVRICYHRIVTMGLCQCEKDEWRSLQNGSWKSNMPLYEQRFVDVKFLLQTSDFVTVTLDEAGCGAVPPAHGWFSGTLLPFGSCLTLCYVIISIIASRLSKKTRK